MSKKDHSRLNGNMDTQKIGSKMKGQLSGKKSERLSPSLEKSLEHAKEYIPRHAERKVEDMPKADSFMQRLSDSKFAKFGLIMLARRWAPRIIRSKSFYGMGLVGLAAYLYRRRTFNR